MPATTERSNNAVVLLRGRRCDTVVSGTPQPPIWTIVIAYNSATKLTSTATSARLRARIVRCRSPTEFITSVPSSARVVDQQQAKDQEQIEQREAEHAARSSVAV